MPEDDPWLLRYGRQILLPELDIKGQQAWGRGRILIIGVGGLGCPAAQYLAAAGVGSLTLCDPDTVSLSNLPRQILYTDAQLGQAKVEAAGQRLRQLHPEATLHLQAVAADDAYLDQAVPAHDIILDCSDNFATRHRVNRACQRWRRPLVSAAALRWEGQLAVFDFRHTPSPCYACLYPDGWEDGEDSCATSGVLGPIPGILGSLQALEALRLLIGLPSPMANRLQLFDGKTLQWRDIALRPDPCCPVCAS